MTKWYVPDRNGALAVVENTLFLLKGITVETPPTYLLKEEEIDAILIDLRCGKYGAPVWYASSILMNDN